MSFYFTTLCFVIICVCYCSAKEIGNKSTDLEQMPTKFENVPTKFQENLDTKTALRNSSILLSQTPFELVSVVELSSNSLPVHARVPRNLRYEKTPRRPQYRHSTRVYTSKPVPFLLPPEITYVNSGHNYFKSNEDKPFYAKRKTEDPVTTTTFKSTTTPSSTPPSTSLPSTLPPVSQPSVILEPPIIEKEHPVYNVIKKYRNRSHKLRYRGQKRYYSRQQLRFLEKKKEDITESFVPTVAVTTTTFSQEILTPESVTVSTIRNYKIAETSSPLNTTVPLITTELIYSPTEEPELTYTTIYNEVPGDNTTQNVSFNSIPFTEKSFPTGYEENYTSINEYTHNDDITSSLLSPEVASMGMKVMATKKGIEMVRQNWFDSDPTTEVYYETNTYESNDVPNENLQLTVAETGDYRTKLLDNFRQHTETQNSVEHVIPGVAGVDYPTYNRPPPNTNKPCSSGVGYVADVKSGCQVFYICIGNGVGEPLLCPNGTLFSQDFLVCDWWYNVECHG